MMRGPNSAQRSHTSGFTLLEFLVVFATFFVLIAGVFSQVGKLQQVYRAEETKVDASQESRTMLDEVAREVRLAGYPGQSLFDPNVLATPLNSWHVAGGIVKISNYELWFEGDVDGDGVVDVVHYMLMDSNGNPVGNGSTCPCTLQRSQLQKVDGVAPLAQASIYTSNLSNILNSGSGNPATGLTLTGTTNGVSNDTLFSAYKNSPVFTPLDWTGTAITALPIDITSTTITSVKSIMITVNILTLNSDLQTKMPVPFTTTVTAKLNN